jgi:hypothetical protein
MVIFSIFVDFFIQWSYCRVKYNLEGIVLVVTGVQTTDHGP